MSRSVPVGGLAALAVIVGIIGVLTVGYAAGARPARRHHAQCPAKAKSEGKPAKRRAKCKKPKPTRRGAGGNAPVAPTQTAPTKTLPVEVHPPGSAPIPLAATLIVHVYVEVGGGEGGLPRTRYTEEMLILRITPLAPGGELPSPIETPEHTVHLPPGQYEIKASLALLRSSFQASETVTVRAGQTLEVTLNLKQYEVFAPPA
jgi:hypothetical protein